MGPCKRALLAAAALALLPLVASGVDAKTVVAPGESAAALSTPLDSVIDLAVAERVATGKITAAQAALVREQLQMQFSALSSTSQQSLLAATKNVDSGSLAERAMAMMTQATADEARSALTAAQAKAGGAQQITPKLGGADGDTVFIATVGPCRVADSRFWFGPIGSGQAQQVYVWSSVSGFSWSASQGGTGNSGAGNCFGDEFFSLPSPVAVVATVSVINTTASGALQAWNGGTTLSGGAVLNWQPGERLSNTTVIQTDRTIAPYPGSGGKRDIAVLNNSAGFTDFVIDVIGFFIANQHVALDCTSVFQGSATPTPAVGLTGINAPSCPAGYTTMTSRPFATLYGQHVARVEPGFCQFGNFVAGSPGAFCDAFCCRVPGR